MSNYIPIDRLYTNEHEWALIEEETATIGITYHAQSNLGDITFVEPPMVGAKVHQSHETVVIESVKAASDVYSPLSGTVTEVNHDVEEHPEIINNDCYGEGWLFKISISDEEEIDDLLSPEEYEELIEKEN